MIDKELKRIPLTYFNETLDRIFVEFINAAERYKNALTEYDRIKQDDTLSMFLTRREAAEKSISKNKKSRTQKLDILNGFMDVTSKMCESRVAEIEYILKVHPEEAADEIELNKLQVEEFGIFEYLAKVENYKAYLQASDQANNSEDKEPEAI